MVGLVRAFGGGVDRSIRVRRSIEVDTGILVPSAALSAGRLDAPVQVDVAGKPHDNQLAAMSGPPVSVSIAQSPATGCPKPCSADSGELSVEVAPTELAGAGGSAVASTSDREIGAGGDRRALQVGPNLVTGNPKGDAARREITSWTR